MIEKQAIVQNDQGIHCRPSAKIVTEAMRYTCEIRAFSEAGEADLRSLLSLVSLGLQAGAAVRIQVSGEDEEAICDHFVKLFETHFDFPPQPVDSRNSLLESLIKG